MANILPADIDLEEYRFLGVQEKESIRQASDFGNQIIARRDGAGAMEGERLPWEAPFRFRPGEVTSWLGYNHHGKSRIAGMCCAWMLPTSRHLIASLEMPADATLERMAAQCAGRLDYTDTWLRQWLKWTDYRLWLYDVQERTASERLLGLCCYAAQELEVNHVWIDSLMQTQVGGEDRDKYARQADFVDEVCRLAKLLQIHIHLVYHLRKPEGIQGEDRVPDRYSARGASELVDRPDNVLIVHKNTAKFRKMGEPDAPDDIEQWRDGTLVVDKQRHARGNGTFRLKMWDGPGGVWSDGCKMQWPVDVYRANAAAAAGVVAL